MDSDAVGQLEKEKLLHMEMSTSSMQNIWAKEVRHTNAFTEARDVIQELLDSIGLRGQYCGGLMARRLSHVLSVRMRNPPREAHRVTSKGPVVHPRHTRSPT
ncbi:hypothetical protein L484_014452 [Morus notabilis]|uniref:Uncharacterized protein n=1 Tax=Morus notabilis TaxID=981085 RepID=W9QRW8_9ROSA|nr:hypothetical protein L484_014452 [Morus notabilis]